jgi:hypothetical protein
MRDPEAALDDPLAETRLVADALAVGGDEQSAEHAAVSWGSAVS